MTLGKASLIAVGFAASMAIGVWMAPYVTDQDTRTADPVETAVVTPEPANTPVRAARTADESVERRIATVAASTPELHKRLKPVLTRGADLELASAGFETGEQFATVAYLARNTGVPFALLKHRVLYEGRSLDKAVSMSKPDINAGLEVNRARAEARAEIWALSGAEAS